MRLDKYLQTSRIIKRRAMATELCKAGRVQVNDQPAKASKELRVGDRIALSFGSRGRLECEVLLLPEHGIRKEEATSLYRTITDTRAQIESRA
jgi:ribosomal 50S subunit-recycling heat shock protein